MRARLAGLLAALAIALAANNGQAQELLLEIWVNGATGHVVAQVVERDGLLLVSRDDLQAAGVIVEEGETLAGGQVAVNRLAGVKVEIVKAEQRLALEVERSRLAPQLFNARAPLTHEPASSATGFIGSYDLAGTIGDFSEANKTASLGAALAGTIFTPKGTLTATGFGQVQSEGSRFVRLDTTAEFAEPDSLRRWLVGDAISGGLIWSRSVRFAGLQLATDFSLRPELATLPLPAFFGETAVPATVDVYVNAARVFETNVEPGPFQIRSLPFVSGGGQATVVIRDVLGRESTQTLSFYTTNALLQKGLSAYDLDLGFLRRSYGEKSFDYSDPLAAATYRHGMTDWLTLEAHGEASKNVQLAGGGAVMALGSFGLAQADAAFSGGEEGQGALYALSFETQPRPFSFFASLNATTGDYADLASADGMPPPRLRTQLGGSVRLGKRGALALSWVSLKNRDARAIELANATYTLSLGYGWYFGASGLYDLGDKKWAAQVFLSLPIDGDLFGSGSVRFGDDVEEERVSLSKPVDPDGGFGYRLSAYAGDVEGAEGEAIWVGPHGSVDAGVSAVNGQVAGRILASGSVVAMEGSLFAARKPNGAVALVKTGEENVRIYRENREVARANGSGEALVTDLVPYASNRIGVEPTDYPFATVVGATQRIAVPRRNSGIVVDLAPASGMPLLVVLQFEDGGVPPVGADVRLGGEIFVLGHRGELFLPDLRAPSEGTLSYAAGSCRFALTPPLARTPDSIPKIGPIDCIKEAANEN